MGVGAGRARDNKYGTKTRYGPLRQNSGLYEYAPNLRWAIRVHFGVPGCGPWPASGHARAGGQGREGRLRSGERPEVDDAVTGWVNRRHRHRVRILQRPRLSLHLLAAFPDDILSVSADVLV